MAESSCWCLQTAIASTHTHTAALPCKEAPSSGGRMLAFQLIYNLFLLRTCIS